MTEPPAGPAPGPRVRVRLPDGQHITAQLTERRRRPDGTWWYVVTLALWSELDDQWGHHAAAYDVVMVVPVESCAAVPGEDYSGVPTVRERG